MPRALITGVAGQDGSYLAELLLSKGYEVFGVVRGSPTGEYGNLAAVRDDVTLLQADLLDQIALLDAISRAEPDELYNLAATSFVPASWRQPVMTAQFTAVGVTFMLEAVRITNPQIRIYQASTSEIFGATTESPQTEETPCRPRNPYAVAKLYGHLMVATYRERYGLHASSGILYNHESPRRPPEFVSRKITRTVAEIKLGLADELRLGNLDATRDWSFAGDVVEAMWLMLQQDTGDDYVVSSGASRTVRDMVAAAFAVVGIDDWERYVTVDESFVRPPDPVPLVGDSAKAQRRLGWTPRVSFEGLVEMMVEADLAALGATRSAR
ncbi:MAG TPA: GDP-mannose 4,6-dehydratase [Solirubrobacteraceae bacterium]|nr:GDP-mannose 4,6-dehydratase [Solirubrobacteraceae bacterium]